MCTRQHVATLYITHNQRTLNPALVQGLIVAHAVGVRKLSVDHVGEDLCVPVRVLAKPKASLDKIIVDHTQGMKVLACECESVRGSVRGIMRGSLAYNSAT